MIDNALGKLVEFSNKYNNYYVASSLIFSSKTGRLRSITYNENLLDEMIYLNLIMRRGILYMKQKMEQIELVCF